MKWTEEQQLAINKEGNNIIVSAGAGSGKTATWRTLAKAFDLYGVKTETKDLNPKSIDSNDLYGNVDDRQVVIFATFMHVKYMNRYVIDSKMQEVLLLRKWE